jgi:hypothetical protein
MTSVNELPCTSLIAMTPAKLAKRIRGIAMASVKRAKRIRYRIIASAN